MAHRLYGIKIHSYHAQIVAFKPIVGWMKEVGSDLFKKAPFVFSHTPSEGDACFMTLFFEHHLARERLTPDFWEGIPSLKDLAEKPLLAHVHKSHLTFCQKTINDS